jgi:hypothetical protein
MRKTFLTLISASCLLFAWSSYSVGQALSATNEVEYFSKYFTDRTQPVPKKVYGELEFSGISDTQLFDIVEQRFLAESNATTQAGIDHAAWLSKALAYSGQSKYLATLNQVLKTTKDVKLKKYVAESIERSAQFAVWNADINRDTANLQGEELYRKRTFNMLRSADSHLVMLGAKRVWFHHPTDSEYIRVASERLLESYNKPNPSVRDIDAIGWLCNVLGKSAMPEYRPLLDKVNSESKNRRIKEYARKNAAELKT